MPNPKHSPGPWKEDNYHGGDYSIDAADGRQVLYIYSDGQIPNQADSDLIVDAPILLRLLKENQYVTQYTHPYQEAYHVCSCCDGDKDYGCLPDCELNNMLIKHGCK